MPVSVPREPCYYYECSDGRVRLTYFIPPNELSKLVSAQKIAAAVRADFPDGVDLDCTEPDFEAFREQYEYRPAHSADALQNAFFAIFSSTRGWKTFQGTGFVPADELEAKIPDVERAVRKVIPRDERPAAAADFPAQPPPLEILTLAAEETPRAFQKRRLRLREAVRRQKKVRRALEQLRVKGVDGKKRIDQQGFRKEIAFSKGISASELFARLQRRQQARGKGGTA